MLNKKRTRVGTEEQYGPRTAGAVLHNFLEKSNEPLSVAYREHLHPHTELCVDLKTILTSDRRAKMRKDYPGVLTRDGREHFTFLENAPERKNRRRYPHIYQGYCINVNRKDDGTLYPTFRHPEYTRYYTFKDFCREAAEELLMVVGLVEE